MANYYFLGTILPDLSLNEKPEIGFAEFEQLLHDNLSNRDYSKVTTIRNFYDIFNLRFYLKEEPLDPFGNLDSNEIEEALITQATLPSYIFDYLAKYENNEERLRHFPEMLSTFFKEEIKNATGAFKQFLINERHIRLILMAFRAKKLGKDLFKELQYEDPEEEFIAQLLAQKDAPEYEPPEEYADIKPILEKNYDNPIALETALCDYRFKKIDQMEDGPFSINRILAYMIKLMMIEKWQNLDKQKGLAIVENLSHYPRTQ